MPDNQPPVATPPTPAATPTPTPPAKPVANPAIQPEVIQASANSGSNKFIIISLVILILIAVVVGGGYYFYTRQMSQSNLNTATPSLAPVSGLETLKGEVDAIPVTPPDTEFLELDKDLDLL